MNITGVKSTLRENIKLNERVTNRNMTHVTKKWDRELRAINEAFDGKIDDYKLLTTAILLENTSNHLQRINEATQPSNVSFFKRYALKFEA